MDFTNEEIRPPDAVKFMTLLDDNNIEMPMLSPEEIYELELEQAIKQSLEEMKDREDTNEMKNVELIDINSVLEISKKEYELIQQEQLKKLKERKIECLSLQQKITKISNYDVANKHIYTELLSAIYNYIEYNELELVSLYNYDNILNVLKSIRLTNDELNFIKKLYNKI